MSRFLTRRNASESSHPVLATAGALVILLVLITVVTLHWFISQRTEALADELILQATEAFEDIPPFTNADAAALRQFPNRVHVERAQQLGIPRIPDRDAAVRMLESANMVRLEDTPYYVVLDLGYSVPYVTADAAHLLDIIGRRFHERLDELGLPRYRFLVTSATRTDDDQRRLRQVNANAAGNSSHFHGTTVDLHYARWDYQASLDSLPSSPGLSQPLLEERLQSYFTDLIEQYHPKLKSILAQVMRETQSDGLVIVTYERMQPVYHITVNQSIAAPDEMASSDERIAGGSLPASADDIDVGTVAPAR